MGKKRTKKGGEPIGSGGYGCVFQPALKCKNSQKTYTRKMVSKLMTTEHVQSEYLDIQKFSKYLKKIPNYKDYFLIWDVSACQPSKLSDKDLVDYEDTCSNLVEEGFSSDVVNNPQILNELKIINMPYGGLDLKNYLRKINMNYQKTNVVVKSLLKLLTRGILPMNNVGVYHCDIKDSNMLVDTSTSKIHTRLIDWGLSYLYSSNIMDELGRRPFQYNLPLSVIVFHSNFFTKYAEAGSPVLQADVKSFVSDYISTIIKKRGLGHISTMHHIHKILYNNPNADISFTLNILSNYITQVVLTFKTNMQKYLPIYLYNIDIWGWCVSFIAIATELGKNKILTTSQFNIINYIKEMYDVLLLSSSVKISVTKLSAISEKIQKILISSAPENEVKKYNNVDRSNYIISSTYKQSNDSKLL